MIRFGLIFLAAIGAGICLRCATERSGVGRADASGAIPPPPGPPTGKCVGIRDGSGPVACPYGPTTVHFEGPDYGEPFAKEAQQGRTCLSPGSLQLTSGGVVAADPLVFLSSPPFTVRFPPGRYPVVFSMVDGDIQYALLKITGERPVRWELALQPGEHPKPGEEMSYPVDSGTGSYLDGDAALRLQRRSDALAKPDLLDVLYAEGYEHGHWANVCVDPATGANLIAFTSGAGDGSYPVYVGYGAAGQPIALVTDFRLGDVGLDRHPWLEELGP